MKFSQHVLHHYYGSLIGQAGSDHEDKPVTAVSHQCPDFTHVDSMKCMWLLHLYARVMHSKSLVSEASMERCDMLALPKW